MGVFNPDLVKEKENDGRSQQERQRCHCQNRDCFRAHWGYPRTEGSSDGCDLGVGIVPAAARTPPDCTSTILSLVRLPRLDSGFKPRWDFPNSRARIHLGQQKPTVYLECSMVHRGWNIVRTDRTRKVMKWIQVLSRDHPRLLLRLGVSIRLLRMQS